MELQISRAREPHRRGGALGTLLALVTSLALLWLVLEVGLRVIRIPGFEPVVGINQPDSKLGWSKKKDADTRKKTKEFDIRFTINDVGLRDDADLELTKPAGEKRILVVGDSFVLGYTVDRNDLFVDLLERSLDSDPQPVQVLNGGTEGWATDQELLWLRESGLKFQPDLVVWCFYQNDVYWSGQDQYAGTPKPRYSATGTLEEISGSKAWPEQPSWWARHSALAGFLHRMTQGAGADMVTTVGSKVIPREEAVVMKSPPADLRMDDCWNRVGACLRGLADTSRQTSMPVLFVAIPSREQVHPDFADRWREKFGMKPDQVDFDLPERKALELATAAGLPTLDPLPAFRASAESGKTLYFDQDWHINPDGNRVLARAIFDRVLESGLLPGVEPTGAEEIERRPAKSMPKWPFVLGGVWLLLGTLYAKNYRDESALSAYLKVGALILSVVTIVVGFGKLAALVPAPWAAYVSLAAVVGILGFVLVKSRSNIGVIFEIYASFVRRGHWYMIPLLVVMLAIGSLLIVASTSPFVAPFIYTLF